MRSSVKVELSGVVGSLILLKHIHLVYDLQLVCSLFFVLSMKASSLFPKLLGVGAVTIVSFSAFHALTAQVKKPFLNPRSRLRFMLPQLKPVSSRSAATVELEESITLHVACEYYQRTLFLSS